MASTPDLIVGCVALLVAGYGLVSVRLSRWSVTAPMAFLLIGAVMGAVSLDLLDAAVPTDDILGQLAEITLALVLFTAASSVRLKRLESDSPIIARLLLIGLPLTVVGGSLLVLGLFPGTSLGLALLIGTTLAPTDADLGHQVITDDSVPARVRRLLNVESGLNDGIVAPVITLAIALAIAGDVSGMAPLADAVTELVLAAIVGVAVGAAGRWLLMTTDRLVTSSDSSRQLATLALALAAYFLAAGLGASGFIAAFVAGLAFGVGHKERVAAATHFSDGLATLLTILVWLVFGLIVFDEYVLHLPDPAVILYALLSLTVVRMAPVAISLMGAGFDLRTVAFIGWFGPRGLASIVFALLGLEALDRAGMDPGPLGAVVAWTVILSVVLHGFSARPLATRFGRLAEALPPDAPERLDDTEPHRSAWQLHGPQRQGRD